MLHNTMNSVVDVEGVANTNMVSACSFRIK